MPFDPLKLKYKNGWIEYMANPLKAKSEVMLLTESYMLMGEPMKLDILQKLSTE